MNFPKIALRLGSICLLTLAGCGKPESASAPAAQPTAPQPNATPAPAAAPLPGLPSAAELPMITEAVVDTLKDTALERAEAARAYLTTLKLPDFQTTSANQLAELASQALTQWHQTVESPAPTLTSTVDALKASLSGNEALNALSSLTKLGDYAKAIPGGEALLQSSKKLVTAWALKQGFDAANIAGALGAIQRGDYAGLAAQAASLFAKGGVNREQKSLLDGVLGAFGLDAGEASGAVNAVRGLLGK